MAVVRRITPTLHCDDAMRCAAWYEALGFAIAEVHRFEPAAPRFVTLRAGDLWLFLSEHEGERADTLVYLHVDDVDAVAARLGVPAEDMAHDMREIRTRDPAGNRVRIGAGVRERR